MSGSALIGSPPNTDDDYYIIKGMFRTVHRYNLDPERGYHFLPKKPSGYQYEDKKGSIVAGLAVVIFVMTLVTGGRLGLRLFRTGLRWGADDWALIPGAIMAIAYPVIQIAMVVYGGGGKHTWDVTYAEYNVFNWLGVVCKILFFTSVGIIKISITLFNRRLTGIASRPWRIAIDVFLGLLVAYTLLALFWTCFQCNPPPAMWDKIYAGKLEYPAVCYSTPLIANALSIIHVTMDFILLMTPIVILWKVKLPTSTKVRLYLVFSTGAVSCIGSVLRQLAQHRLNLDITYGYTGILTWTLVDLTFALLTASLPVLVGLIPSAWRSVTKASSSSRTPNSGGDVSRGYMSTRSRQSRVTFEHREMPQPPPPPLHPWRHSRSERSDEGGILEEQEEEYELTYHHEHHTKERIGTAV